MHMLHIFTQTILKVLAEFKSRMANGFISVA